jgi:hypothetical protein
LKTREFRAGVRHIISLASFKDAYSNLMLIVLIGALAVVTGLVTGAGFVTPAGMEEVFLGGRCVSSEERSED